MTESAVLRFTEMALRPKGTLSQRLVRVIISLALRLFFRRIETSGAGMVPRDEPLIFVLNHPNGLIDPALVFCAMPRRISFLAKSTLFEMPVIRGLLRLVEALPLYRRADAPADVSLNLRTFARSRELLRQNRCIAIFPEGRSHDSTTLLPIKTGAARIALGALSVEGGVGSGALTSLKIIPAGLYYTSKTSFRSEALIRFGESFAVKPVVLDDVGEPPREAVVELSAQIESALRDVTINVANDSELETVARAEQLFSSIYETLNFRLSLAAEFDLRRRFAEVMARERRQPPSPRVERLRERLREFDEDLGGFGIAPENLSVLAHSRWFVVRSFLLRWLAVALVSPLAVAGALLHLPAYLACTFVSRLYRRHGVDEIAPTVKILSAILLMPLTWIVFSVVIYFWHGWRWALAAIPATILCGYVAVRSLETLYDLRGWFRAALLLARDRRRFLRLLRERRTIHREMRAMARELLK